MCGAIELPVVSRPDEDSLADDHFHDQCGVFGVYGSSEASHLTYLGLHALQHRGQESAGIAVVDEGRLTMHRELGLVRDVFSANVLKQLTGDRAIGHVRYSTAGETHVKNAQPLAVDYALGSLSVAHNGNFTNYEEFARGARAKARARSFSRPTTAKSSCTWWRAPPRRTPSTA